MTSRSLRLLPCLSLSLLFSLLTTPLRAQAKLAVYGTIGGETSGASSWATAGTLGLYIGVKDLGPIALALDGRADLSSNIKSGLVGPRIALHPPVFPLKPYAELLIGGSSVNKQSSQFAGRYVLGVDTTILPRVDWRVIDFSEGINKFANGHAKTVSTGLVLRF